MIMRIQRVPLATHRFDRVMNLEQGIDDLFGSLIESTLGPSKAEYPVFDIAEYEDEFVIVAEMPGVKKGDLKISVLESVITISGERKPHALREKAGWIRNEIATGSFTRTIELPQPIKADQISAELSNGVLRIVAAKREDARPREIKVK